MLAQILLGFPLIPLEQQAHSYSKHMQHLKAMLH